MSVVRQGDLQVSPWQNGKGRKADVAAGDGWFVGLAWIEADAPFSHFPGTDRTCVLVSGAGFTLSFDGRGPAVYREPGDLHAFPGDLPTRAEVSGGPSLVFNVMTRRDGWTHAVTLTGALPAAGYAVVLRGTVGTVGTDGGPAVPGDVLVLPHDGEPGDDLLLAAVSLAAVGGPTS